MKTIKKRNTSINGYILLSFTIASFCFINKLNAHHSLPPYVREAGAANSNNNYTYSDIWDFTVDKGNPNNGNVNMFNWWVNGGNNVDDLMMQLVAISASVNDFELVTGKISERVSDNLNIWVDSTRSHIQGHGDENGLDISSKTGNKLLLEDVDNPAIFQKIKLVNEYNINYTWDNLTMWSDDRFAHIHSNGDDDGLEIASELGNTIYLGDQNDTLIMRRIRLVNESAVPAPPWDHLTMRVDGTRSYIQSYGDEDGLDISSKTGNKISLGDTDDKVVIGSFVETRASAYTDWAQLTLIANNDNKLGDPNTSEDIVFGFNGSTTTYTEEMRLTSEGNLGIGNNNPLATLDVDGDVILNHGTGETLTKVSINTDSHVDNATITIAGSTYIGPQAEKASTGSLDKFKAEYLDDYNLWVEDGIVTENIVMVSVDQWRDVVFSENYKLKPLEDVEVYINAHKHLPGVKSKAEVKKEGYSVQEMDVTLLEKVEELTLYTIAQEKKIKKLEKELQKYSSLEDEILKLRELIVSSQK